MEIQTKNLITEIKAALEDLFVAEIEEEEGKLLLKFENGQKFALSLEES